VSHAITGFVAVKIVGVIAALKNVAARKTSHNLIGGNEMMRRSINFHSVTRAQKQSLVAAAFPQDPISFSVARKVFPDFHVRGVVTQTDAK
jgi:hypothetical protein